jgi:DNA repair protein RecO (recombination protein O)
MKQITTQGIVLTRTDYGEADRILKFLTPNHGKVSAIAKGVRKSKSKLAGGIELFSVSELSFIVGRSEIYTTTSARLLKYYDNIVKDLNRTSTAYEFIRVLNRATEDSTESAYFTLLNSSLMALDDLDLDPEITKLWFNMQLIEIAGHSPNLQTDTEGNKLSSEQNYNFDFDHMHFVQSEQGKFNANHIKFLRLGFAASKPQIIHKITDAKKISDSVQPLIQTILQTYIRV